MQIFDLAFFVFVISICLIPILLLLKFKKNFDETLLDTFITFLVVNNLSAVTDLIVRHFFYRIISRSAEVISKVEMLYSSMVLLITILYIYVFLRFIFSLKGYLIQRKMKIAFFVFWFIFFAVLIFSQVISINHNDTRLSSLLYEVFIWTCLVFMFGGLITVLIKPGDGITKSVKSFARNIFLYYMISFVIHTVLVFYLLHQKSGPLVINLFLLVLNLPVSLYIYLYLKNKPVIIITKSNGKLSVLKEKYSLTKREVEIIRLVIIGKTNTNIKKELFVSLRTIESHLYNIYRKMKIENRYQLISQFLDNPKE